MVPRSIRQKIGAFQWIALALTLGCSLAATDANAGFDTDPCAVELRRAMAARGFSVALDDTVPAGAPSVVDHVCRERAARGVDVMIALGDGRAHVEAPFIRYREARLLAHRAMAAPDPLCHLTQAVERAAAHHARLRWTLLAGALAGAIAFTALLGVTRRRIGDTAHDRRGP